MLISVEIGRDNWQEGSLKVNAFLWRQGMPEMHMWMIGTDKAPYPVPANIQKAGAPMVASAGNGLNPDIVGKWTTQVYDLPPGTIIKVNVVRTSNGGRQLRSANILLRIRDGAALRRISIDTTANNRRSKTRLVYEGRFDILTVEQAKAAGYRIPPAYAPTYNVARWTSYGFIHVEQRAPETVSQTVVRTKRVINSSGQTVEVQNAQQKRALDL